MANLHRKLREYFSGAVLELHDQCGDETAVVVRERLPEIARFLKENPEFDMNLLMDLTAVDGLGMKWQPRFQVVYHFYSLAKNQRLRLKVPVDEKDCWVPTLTHLWPIADWFEREVWDMFGIRFEGHPNLRRILMYEEFEGHPLRKDYPYNKRQPLIGPGAKPRRNHESRLERENVVSQNSKNTVKKTRTESMLLNVGPSHPAMHGIIRIITELDGETVTHSEVEIGYLHRAFEKSAELAGYLQVIPYTDRLNYVSPLINNTGYSMAVEKLFGLEIPERAQFIRVIMNELSRVSDHLTCIGASAMELGAFTAFLYMIKAREYIYQLIEEVTGARVTVSYVRPGGVKGDLPPGFDERCYEVIAETRKVLKEVHALLTQNRIFVDRLKDTGVISRGDALAYGITGPFLRSTGVDYDVRRASSYLVYDRFDFEIPLGEHGDNYDRYLCRMEEMEQSLRIVEQALEQIPPGPVLFDMEGRVIPADEMRDEGKRGHIEDVVGKMADFDPTLEGGHKEHSLFLQTRQKRVVMPPKEETYTNIEGLMHHFKTIMSGHGIRPPRGEAYCAVEGANGELGFYVVSDGTDTPYRVRVRPPCFVIMAALPLMLKGGTVADIIATFGSVNMIGGELDR